MNWDQGLKDLIASGGIAGSPDAPPPKAEISAMHTANGMGEPYEHGSYVAVHIAISGGAHMPEAASMVVLISEGAAEVLRDELKALI